MKACLALLAVAACGTDSPATVDGPITGSIDRDLVVTGDAELEGFVTIEPGATVTVEAGANVHVAAGASIEVDGALVLAGTKDAPITFGTVPGEFWLGTSVFGSLDMRYTTQFGGGVFTNAPEATATITDSQLSNAVGDFLVMNDGNLDVSFTNVGLPTNDHTHCNVHINGAQSIRFTHNNNVGVAYGLMLYAGSGDFTHDNWIGNVFDIEPEPAGTGHFDGGYFEAGQPHGVVGSTFDSLATTPLTDVGPR